MLGPLLMLQLVVISPARPDSVYGSAALKAFIAAAAEANHTPPVALRGFRARIESELSLLIRDTLGRERAAQIEQVALNAEWQRDREYDLRVIGYRSQSVGVPYSALSIARSWTIPYLYGDRLTLGVDVGQLGRSRGRPGRADSIAHKDSSAIDTLIAVHPLAADRDRFYHFAGGDTVAVLRSGNREIPIVRVQVTPALDSAPRTSRIGAFEGEIDFDAARHQIVRMRGRFVATAPRRGRMSLARLPGVVAVAYVEFVNAEVDGQYWLPTYQRSEFQATFAPLGADRSIFRLVSRFTDLNLTERSGADSSGRTDSTIALLQGTPGVRRRVSYAPDDSISRYQDWSRPLGAATTAVSASDFDDLAPDAWRTSGAPRLELAPNRLGEVLRFNRVEGAYTGVAVNERFRDALPGLTAHMNLGWAWSENTPRGGAFVAYGRGQTTVTARIARNLASTNDFTPPLEDGGGGFGALVGGIDEQDYVDRRVTALGLTRAIGSARDALLILDGGAGDDRPEEARLVHSPIGGGRFRLNRWSMPGSYLRGAATLELRPDVTGIFLEPGVGLIVSYEAAHGSLNWQRAELMIAARKNVNDFAFSARAQGGVVSGRVVPPQELFELGGENALPGYGYKQFAGNHAAVAGALAAYGFPVLRRPWRAIGELVIPGLSPGIAAGVQGGWAEASTDAAATAIRHLDPNFAADCVTFDACPAALSTPTKGIRATVDARLTFFGGLIGVGMGRPVDRSARWRLVFRFGQTY